MGKGRKTRAECQKTIPLMNANKHSFAQKAPHGFGKTVGEIVCDAACQYRERILELVSELFSPTDI
jgi:hypothetical protein